MVVARAPATACRAARGRPRRRAAGRSRRAVAPPSAARSDASLSGCQRSSWSQSAISSASAGASAQGALEVAIEAEPLLASATATKRGSSPITSRERAARASGREASSQTTQTQRSSVCARSDSTWIRNSAGSGSNVAMQIAIRPSGAGRPSSAAARAPRPRSARAARPRCRPPGRDLQLDRSRPGRRHRHDRPEAAAPRGARRAASAAARARRRRHPSHRRCAVEAVPATNTAVARARRQRRRAAGSRGSRPGRRHGRGNLSFRAMPADPHDNRAFLADARRSSRQAREPRAGAPGPDAEALRQRLPRPAQATPVRPGRDEHASRSARCRTGR